MSIIISSSLTGRDLAIVKSMLNILNGDEHASWDYQDDNQNCQIHLTKDYNEHGAEYYALIKTLGEKIGLGSTLNPKIVRKFFEQLDVEQLESKLEFGASSYSDNSSKIINSLYNYINSHSLDLLAIHCNEKLCLIDRVQNTVKANTPITDPELVKLLTATDLQTYQVANVKELETKVSVSMSSLVYSNSLKTTLWHLGYLSQDSLAIDKIKHNEVSFKQVSWPDYGSLPFENSFIFLSSRLWRRAETVKTLLEHSATNKSTVYRFINACCLAGYIVPVFDNVVTSEQMVAKKPESFLAQLKSKLFGSKESLVSDFKE